MDQTKHKTVIRVETHLKNGEALDTREPISYEITKRLVNKIGLDRLVAVYVPSLNKEASA